ncbi:hypothetical protein Tco_1173487 [Tanacetum coccineum]
MEAQWLFRETYTQNVVFEFLPCNSHCIKPWAIALPFLVLRSSLGAVLLEVAWSPQHQRQIWHWSAPTPGHVAKLLAV